MQNIVTAIQKLKHPNNRPLVIAISGYGGSGKSTLATKLKEQLGDAQVIAADDFIIGRTEHRADNSGEWSSYDHARLVGQVLEPALQGKHIRYQAYDWPNDKLVWRTVPRSMLLIIEGVSILRPELLSYYDYKIWVNCPLEVATKRGMQRDRAWGANHDDLWLNVWAPTQRDLMAKYRPDLSADIQFNTHN